MSDHISWQQIKEYYVAKKAAWALTTSYYGVIWGSCESYGHPDGKYGYQLLEPYTEAEVAMYEQKSGLTLPTQLREYLINVSREIFTSSYPLLFRLFNGDPEEYVDNDPRLDIGTFSLPLDKNVWYHGDCILHGNWSKCPEEECEFASPCNGLRTISNGGCTDQDEIVVRGNQIGSIFSNGNGGDALYRNSITNFYDYVTAPIKWSLSHSQII